MSLRVRLSLILGSAFVIIWVLAAAWMLRDLRQQMMFSLDQRLVASARMVAGLIDQLPQPLTAKGGEAHISADQFSVPDGMACQVSSLRGEILASNHKHDGAMDDQRSGFRDQTIDGALNPAASERALNETNAKVEEVLVLLKQNSRQQLSSEAEAALRGSIQRLLEAQDGARGAAGLEGGCCARSS